MSAWVVSKEHIDYLVGAAIDFIPRPYRVEFAGVEVDYTTAHDVGRALWRENVNSVSYLYDGRYDEEHPQYATYRWQPPETAYDPVVILKQIACYEYQSCEHPDWKTSAAKAFCESLHINVVRRLAGWDNAPWGI